MCFLRLQRSVGICFVYISTLVLAVTIRSETAVKNRVEGSGDAEPYLHQPWSEETEKQRSMGGGLLAHRPRNGRGREDVPYSQGQDASAAERARDSFILDLEREGGAVGSSMNVRHDVVAVAITGDRQTTLRHLVGVCHWSED